MSFSLVTGEIGEYVTGPDDVVFATANGRIFPEKQGVTPERLRGERRERCLAFGIGFVAGARLLRGERREASGGCSVAGAIDLIWTNTKEMSTK